MRTWETTLRLVHDKAASPLLVGLVLEEIECEIQRFKRRRDKGNGQSLTKDEEIILRGHILKRFLLFKKLTEMLYGTKVDSGRRVEEGTSTNR